MAILFALTVLPMMMAAGTVIDYAANSNARQQAQVAVDSAALSLAKLPVALTDADLSSRATRQVSAALSKSQVVGLAVTMLRSGDSIRVTARGTTPTTLTRVLGFTSMPLNVTSMSRRGSGNLEIALVLDNTGSMRGTKLTNLKSAATDLVNTLFLQVDPTKPSALKIAIVPFSMTVNVGVGNVGADWLDKDGLASYHSEIFATKTSRLAQFARLGVAWGGCVESRPTPYDVSDTAASPGTPDTLFVPYFAPDESDRDGQSVNDYLNDYTNLSYYLVYDNRLRQSQVAKYGTAWTVGRTDRSGGSDGYLYGPNAGCELQPITPLTTAKSVLTTAIANLTVMGDTNIPMGLVWGWHALSPNGPLVKGVDYADTTTRKFVVLMTDGQNQNLAINSDNGSYYSGIGYIWANRIGVSATNSNTATRGAALDARLATLCTNMKRAGIQLFTVRVEVTTGTSDILKTCASSPSMFYDVADSANLATAFRAIGAQISELRLAR